MGQKRVSVLMVNYNHEDTVAEAIQSVLDQTYTNFQLIIVDDGSTDRSKEIIESFEDDRIEFYQMDKNRHICEATNYGFTKIRGDYLARIDSDDLWKRSRLEKQLQYLSEHPDCPICFSWINLIDENGANINDKEKALLSLFETKSETQKEWLRAFFYEGNCLCHSSVLMTRELADALGEFNRAYMQAHDFDYWVRAAKRCSCMHVMQERLVSLRRYREETINNSACSVEQNTRFFNEYADIRKHFFEDLSDEVFADAFREDFKRKEAKTREELECEKAFLLCTPIFSTNSVPAAGMEALITLMNDKRIRELLEEKYHYTAKDFYKLSCSHVYCDAYLESMVYQEKKLEQELHLREEAQRQLQRNLSEYEHSFSWRITRPVRKAGDCIRRIRGRKQE